MFYFISVYLLSRCLEVSGHRKIIQLFVSNFSFNSITNTGHQEWNCYLSEVYVLRIKFLEHGTKNRFIYGGQRQHILNYSNNLNSLCSLDNFDSSFCLSHIVARDGWFGESTLSFFCPFLLSHCTTTSLGACLCFRWLCKLIALESLAAVVW